MARRVVKRFRQKGKKLRDRQKRYRRTKNKSRRQSAKYRMKYPSRVERARKRRARNPQRHRLHKRASEITFSGQVPYWDTEKDQEGGVWSVLPEDDKVQIEVGDELVERDLFEFLDNAAFLDEESEAEFFELLDPLYDGPEDGGVEE